MKTLAVFGDSIMRGVYWDEISGKYKVWRNPYLSEIERQTGLQINNHSQMGSTITRGRMLFDKAISRGLACDYLLLEFGGNDCDYDWQRISAAPDQKHLPKTPLALFEDNLEKFITKARSLNMQPLLLALPPINAQKYFAWLSKNLDKKAILHWLEEVTAIYRQQELYSLATIKMAEGKTCPLIDVRSAFLVKHDQDELIGSDGLHPTIKGHNLIWKIISQYLSKNKAMANI